MLSSRQAGAATSAGSAALQLGSAAMLARCSRPLPRLASLMAPSCSGLGSMQQQMGGSSRKLQACQAQHASSATSSAATAWKGPGAPRVVVLGGGFGGLYAAVRLDQLMWPRGTKPQITLIDRADKFVFKPLLYEVLNNTASEVEVAPSFSQVLAPYPIRFIQAEAKSVEHAHAPAPASPGEEQAAPQAGRVTLADGTTVEYDFLIVALGSQPDARGVPGVRERAVPFNTYEDAMTVKGSLDALVARGSGGSVMVVGAGYTGVELAATVAELLKGRSVAVQLVTPGRDVLEASPPGQRDSARATLVQLGVQIVTGARVRGVSAPNASAGSPTSPPLATACCVQLAPVEGNDPSQPGSSIVPSALEADLVVWTAGSAPTTKEARSGFPFPVTDKGALRTEPTLRVHGEERVFALGDVAVSSASGASTSSSSSPSEALPATAQVAFQQADYAAWNIWATINGRPLLPFRYQHLGSMMALGSLNGAVALPVSLPQALVSSLQSTPLGTLLDTAGVKLGSSAEAVDSGSGVTIEGPLAAVMRRAAYLYRQPTNEQRIGVATSWLQQLSSSAADMLSKK